MRRRATAGLCLSGALLACKMNNPAFGDEVETRGTDTSDSVGTDTQAEDGTGSSDTSADAASGDGDGDSSSSGDGDGDSSSSGDGDSSDGDTTETGDGDGDTTESGDGDGDGDACDLPFHDPLRFRILVDTSNLPCPEAYVGDMLAIAASNEGGIVAQACGTGCSECNGPELELQAWPYPLGDVAEKAVTECIHANFDAFVATTAEGCEYGRARIAFYEDPGLNAPLVIGSSVDGAIPEFASDFFSTLGLLPWTLDTSEFCDCPVDNSDPCCSPDDPPSTYDLQVGQIGQVKPQESLEFSAAQAPYRFTLWQAQKVDSCGAPLETSWIAHPL